MKSGSLYTPAGRAHGSLAEVSNNTQSHDKCYKCRQGKHLKCSIWLKPNHGMKRACGCSICKARHARELKEMRNDSLSNSSFASE